MSVTETTRYIYCHAIDWLRISSCYQIYIYIYICIFWQKYLARKRKKVLPRYFQKKLLESSKIHLCSPRITISIPLFVFPKRNRSKRLIDHKFWKKKKKKNNNPTIKVEHWISSNFKIQTIFPKARPRRISKPWSFPRERSRWERRRTRIVAFG